MNRKIVLGLIAIIILLSAFGCSKTTVKEDASLEPKITVIKWVFKAVEESDQGVTVTDVSLMEGKDEYQLGRYLGTPEKLDKSNNETKPGAALSSYSVWYGGSGYEFTIERMDEKTLGVYIWNLEETDTEEKCIHIPVDEGLELKFEEAYQKNDVKLEDQKTTKENEIDSDTNVQGDKKPTALKSPAAKAIGKNDFTVTGDGVTVQLGAWGQEFKQEKMTLEHSEYVGEVFSGDFMYKYWLNSYKEADLFISNANYNRKGKTIDDRCTAQIHLKNPMLKTARDIAVGATLEDVIKAYGDGEKKKDETGESIEYTYNDMELKFTIDEKGQVKTIELNIIVE